MIINKRLIKYSKRDDIHKSSIKNIIKIRKRVLISGDLVFFANVVGKVNMSSYWCHWCNLSAKQWSEITHKRNVMDNRFIEEILR